MMTRQTACADHQEIEEPSLSWCFAACCRICIDRDVNNPPQRWSGLNAVAVLVGNEVLFCLVRVIGTTLYRAA